MKNRQSGITAGAIIFAILTSQAVSHEMKLAGQPFWLTIMTAAIVAGSLAGAWTYVAGRIRRV